MLLLLTTNRLVFYLLTAGLRREKTLRKTFENIQHGQSVFAGGRADPETETEGRGYKNVYVHIVGEQKRCHQSDQLEKDKTPADRVFTIIYSPATRHKDRLGLEVRCRNLVASFLADNKIWRH